MAIFEKSSLGDIFSIGSPADGDVAVLVSPVSSLVVGCWRYRASLTGWFPEGNINLGAVRDASILGGGVHVQAGLIDTTWDSTGVWISTTTEDAWELRWKMWSTGVDWANIDGIMCQARAAFDNFDASNVYHSPVWEISVPQGHSPSTAANKSFKLDKSSWFRMSTYEDYRDNYNSGDVSLGERAWSNAFMSRVGSSGGTKLTQTGMGCLNGNGRSNHLTSTFDRGVNAGDIWGDGLIGSSGNIGVRSRAERTSGGQWFMRIAAIAFTIVEGGV